MAFMLVSQAALLPEDYNLSEQECNIYIGDFNGDQRDDFIRQEKGSDIAQVFLNNNDGTFTIRDLPESFILDGNTFKLFLGDFNGDGLTDFLRQDSGNQNDATMTASVFLADGSGGFTMVNLPENYCLEHQWTNIYIGDFDGDGMDDFIRQEKGDYDVGDDIRTAELYLSNGDGTFIQSVLPKEYDLHGSDGVILTVGDFNGDGKDDFIRQEPDFWIAQLFLSTGDGLFNPADLSYDFALVADLTTLYVGDFNGDGVSDFIRQEKGKWVENDEVNTANVFLSNGDGTFLKVDLPVELKLKGSFTNLYVGDFNGDSKDDFIRQEKADYAGDSKRTHHLFLSNGDGTFNQSPLPEDSYALSADKGANILIGDFNGDNVKDFLRQERGAWGSDRINTAEIFFSNADSTFKLSFNPIATDLYIVGVEPGQLPCIYNGEGHVSADFVVSFVFYAYNYASKGASKYTVRQSTSGSACMLLKDNSEPAPDGWTNSLTFWAPESLLTTAPTIEVVQDATTHQIKAINSPFQGREEAETTSFKFHVLSTEVPFYQQAIEQPLSADDPFLQKSLTPASTYGAHLVDACANLIKLWNLDGISVSQKPGLIINGEANQNYLEDATQNGYANYASTATISFQSTFYQNSVTYASIKLQVLIENGLELNSTTFAQIEVPIDEEFTPQAIRSALLESLRSGRTVRLPSAWMLRSRNLRYLVTVLPGNLPFLLYFTF